MCTIVGGPFLYLVTLLKPKTYGEKLALGKGWRSFFDDRTEKYKKSIGLMNELIIHIRDWSHQIKNRKKIEI